MSKILVIEDDLVTRRLLVNAIEGMDHTAIQASDGLLGLGILLDNSDIDLLITDLMMPGMSGSDVVRTIRGNQRWQGLPILMVSGVVSLAEITSILELGATRFIPKPIDLGDLRKYISTCCEDYG